jgi:predicted enzyme related to lactoylglutathione lyase
MKAEPKNPIVYWELASHDAVKSVAFFKKAFGWKFAYDEKTTIHDLLIPKEDNRFAGGGIFTLSKARLPFLTLYIRVGDVDRKARDIEALGGLLVVPPFDIAKDTRICLFNEPSGVTFALIQARKKTKSRRIDKRRLERD